MTADGGPPVTNVFHAITEPVPGVFGTLLGPCRCQILAQLVFPAPDSVVWLVAYHPHGVMEWVEMPLPLAVEAPAERVRARLPRYDLEFPLPAFLARLPTMHARAGMLALQMRRPVPDTLGMDFLVQTGNRHTILRRHGWMLSFDLPHDGEPAWVETPVRAHLERLLADPVVAALDQP